MRNKLRFTPSLEAVSYGKSTDFFDELTEHFTDMKMLQPNKYSHSDSISKIQDLITKHTNLSVVLEIEDANYINACCSYPHMRTNHIFTDECFVDWVDPTGLDAKYRRMEKQLGGFSRETGKVSGIFSKTLFIVAITTKAVDKLTAPEVAAVVLHEIGHLFTYVEMFAHTTRMNYAMEAILAEMKGTEGHERRMTLLRDWEVVLHDIFTDKESMVEEEGGLNIIINEMTRRCLFDKNNASLYTSTSCEAAADNYAARYGAGKALIAGLHKMHLDDGEFDVTTGFERLVLSVFNNVFIVASLPVTLPLMILFAALGMGGPAMSGYDKLPARLQRIRRTMIGELRQGRLTKAATDAVLRDIKEIDEVISKTHNGDTVILEMLTWMFSSVRNQKKALKHEQVLEELADSDLYITAAKLDQLARQSKTK